jgi:hypothetical protein
MERKADKDEGKTIQRRWGVQVQGERRWEIEHAHLNCPLLLTHCLPFSNNSGKFFIKLENKYGVSINLDLAAPSDSSDSDTDHSI